MKRYEQSIRVITAFFAVLLGFGLKKLLDAEAFDPPNARWPCFLMSVFLFLRLLLGSNNHMWFEFVYPDRDANSTFSADRRQVLNDFLFLVVFGLIGVAICYSTTLDEFLKLNLLLTGVGLGWVIVYELIGLVRRKMSKQPAPILRGNWNYWGWVNLVQFCSILVVHCLIIPGHRWTIPWWPSFLPGPAWDGSLFVLVGVYVIVFAWDFRRQLKILEKAT
jgi:hypothetical protein